MKNLLLLLALFILFTTANAEQTCCGKIQTAFETNKIAGNFGVLDLTFITKHEGGDVSIDSIWYSLPDGFLFQSNSLAVGAYTGDSLQIDTLSLSYDTSNLPFFLKEIRMYMLIDSVISMSPVYIYFAPWDTVEIWNDENNPIENRNWLADNNLDTPQRVYIDPDTLPGLPDTTLPICWKQYEGLAYEIPVNCDSADTVGQGKIGKTFRGTVSGRLIFQYTNELGNAIDLEIANARVEVYKGWRRIAVGQTDNDGFFELDYDYFTLNLRVCVNLLIDSIKEIQFQVQILNNFKETPLPLTQAFLKMNILQKHILKLI